MRNWLSSSTHLDWPGGIGLGSRSVVALEVSSSILPDTNLGRPI